MLEFLGEELKGIDIRVDEPLKECIYMKVGGPADYLTFPRDRYELARVVTFANKNNIPQMVLGDASDIIVRDGGIRGFVIMFDKLSTVTVNDYVIEAEAGVNLIETTRIAKFHSLTDFEFTCDIPGSAGDAVFMNAGAYDGEISHILVPTQMITKEGEIKTIEARDMKFGYHHSAVQNDGDVVISARFALKPGDYALIEQEMVRLTHLRELKQPLEYPSCGPVFKRPVGHFVGQLVNETNLKGHRIGGVEVNKKHVDFMVNVANDNTQDYEGLITYIINIVEQNSGVHLEHKVRVIGGKKH